MPSTEVFLNKQFVQRRSWLAFLVIADGMHKAARAYGCTARRESNIDELTEIHGEQEQVVDSIVSSNRIRLSMGFREIISPTLQNMLFGSGVAPTIETRETLARWLQWGNLLIDDPETALPAEFRMEMYHGIPQAHNGTLFPAPANPDLSHTTETGTFGADDYYGWVVPLFVCQDPKYGFGDLTVAQILTNLASWTRGVQFTYGTPSASESETLAAPGGFTMTWDEVTTGPKPTHYAVVVGTADDITDGGSKIAAVVEYGTTTALLSDPGSTAFGTSPAVTDLRKGELGSVSASTRVWTPKTEDTDYEFDGTTGIWKRKSGGAIADGAPVRLSMWHFQSPGYTQPDGSTTVTQKYAWIRFVNILPTDEDPADDRPRGAIIDLPRCQLAARDGDLLTAGEDGFHGPVTVNITAERSQTEGYAWQFRGFHPQFDQLLDYYSNDIAASAA